MRHASLSILILSILLFAGCQKAPPKGPQRLRFEDEGRFGFIDLNGEIAIPARFMYAGKFSGGLANATEDGWFGYIDESGEWAIAPEYAFCEPFCNGTARVWKDYQTWFIDREGRQILPPVPGVEVSQDSTGWLRVKSRAGKFGLVSPTGLWAVDTLADSIGQVSEGLISVYANGNCRVVDSLGETRIPPGKFEDIGMFRGAKSLARSGAGWSVIDRAGRVQWTVPETEWEYWARHPHFEDELVRVKVFEESGDRERLGLGYVDEAGELEFWNKDWNWGSRFNRGRGFVRTYPGYHRLVDESGDYVWDEMGGASRFEYLDFRSFENIITDASPFSDTDWEPQIRNDYKLGAVNRLGWFKSVPIELGKLIKDERIDIQYGMYQHPYLFIPFKIKPDSNMSAFGRPLIHNKGLAVWNSKKNHWKKLPAFWVLEINEENGWFYVMKEDRIGWIDENANWIIKGKPYISQKLFMGFLGKPYSNIFAINQLSNIQYFPPKKIFNPCAPRGVEIRRYQPSEAKCTDDLINKPDSFTIQPLPSKIDTLNLDRWGFQVRIINPTNKKYFFRTGGYFQIPLILQAKDQSGKWVNLEENEYLKTGNYPPFAIYPKTYWTLIAPKYSGAIETEMRFLLYFYEDEPGAGLDSIVSPSFPGHVNPGQFFVPRQKLFDPLPIYAF